MSEIVFRKLDQAFAIIIPTYQWKKLRLRDVNYNTHSPTASKCWKYNLNPGLCDSTHDAITQQPKIGVILSVYLWGNGGSEQWHNLPSLKTWVNITTGNRTWTSHNAAFLQRGHIGERRRYLKIHRNKRERTRERTRYLKIHRNKRTVFLISTPRSFHNK